VYLSPSLSIVFEDIEAESTATAAVKKQEGSFSNIDFTYGVTIDKRNQSFEPTSGYVSKFTQSLPLLFDKSSILNSFNATTYHGFSENVIGATRFLGQMITGVKGEDVRLTNRLFIPQNRLRGFNVRKVGPKDGIDWIGGNYITAVGFEAKLPNLLPEATKTDLSVFIDVANVWGVDFNSSIKDTNQLRSAVGVAANVFTILGPLSFTLAQDLAKASTDETQTFNFRIGTSF
jgi:outer membrane protein insertion porin family